MKENRKEKAKKVTKILKDLFPNASISLNYSNPWELLVAVRLSAQCTDRKVNEVTQTLFKKYKHLDDYVKADLREFEIDIRPTGFYRTKAKSILESARMIKERYGGKVPDTMEELLTLPGIARKSAVIVLGNAYNKKEEGIAVDTHVIRFTKKLGLSDHTDPVRIEKDLMEIVPKKDWAYITYGLIEYGRNICPARKHKGCEDHPLTKLMS